jgi:hypothetical protein
MRGNMVCLLERVRGPIAACRVGDAIQWRGFSTENPVFMTASTILARSACDSVVERPFPGSKVGVLA